jgi:hypothetical protein
LVQRDHPVQIADKPTGSNDLLRHIGQPIVVGPARRALCIVENARAKSV